jgi:hypothetical protein
LEKVFSIQSDLSCYRQLQSVVVDAQWEPVSSWWWLVMPQVSWESTVELVETVISW